MNKIKLPICFLTILFIFSLLPTLFAEKADTLASKELFEKFRAVSEKVCRDMETQMATFGGGISSMNGGEQKVLEDVVKQESSELMSRFQNAFLISESDARNFFAKLTSSGQGNYF